MLTSSVNTPRCSPPPFAALTCLILALPAPWAHAQYVDTSTSCLLCHQTTLPQNDFCQLVPAAVWAKSDKHNRAFFLLHESDPADPARGAAKRELVQRILGFELHEAFVDVGYSRLHDGGDAETARKVAIVKACLRCHGTWPKEADEKFVSAPPVPLNLGVSCQACHGPGEKWEPLHRLVAWRLVTPAAKAALGCTDVRSPAAKARLCASCHVGNVAEEKLVKHEWYAAGHPPLPSFELAAFQSQMPIHWKPLREKGAFAFRDARPRDDGGQIAGQIAALQRGGIPADAIKASYREANFPAAAAAGLDPCVDLARTKDAMIGGVVVFENYVRIVGDYSELAAKDKAAWPELSLYDCTACHHELRSRLGLKDRPQRSHAPGRPPRATWPLVLARLGAQSPAASAEDLAHARWSAVLNQLQDLDNATTVRPFGEPAAMSAAAAALTASLEQVANAAAAARYDEMATKRAIAFLTDPAHLETNDFATARQAAWAIRELAADLGEPRATALFFRGSEDSMALSLPSGQDRSVTENLSHWLPAAAHYDAEWFRNQLSDVRARLAP